MNRTELQRLASARLEDARIMLAHGRWAAAYYLAGYAIECGLKSCVLSHLDTTGMIFKDGDYLKSLAKCWTHKLPLLITLAGLDSEFESAKRANAAFASNWGCVKDWTETSRYEEATESKARDLIEAISNDPDGVLKWVQRSW